ncbi:MAG TPA: Flp pilus assembly protein CpaB [Bryobacteraceae bacterium]|nr:Flp pilus assembly protein CpaB [Bryobacteraceae bacterium]
MNKNNLIKLLGVALVVAIISTGLFYGLFASRLNSGTGGRTVVVASRALKPGTVIATADVKTVAWPADHVPKGAYADPNDVVGTTVFDPIGEEEPVVAARLATAQSAGGSGVPEGMRAVSVHVTDSTGVMALLRAGQKVDVQVVVGRGQKPNDIAVRTALENLTILSVTPQAEQSSQGHQVPVVTLLAKPQEADVLAAADSGATVRLSLRNPLDNATRTREALPLGAVMRGSR